MRYIAKENDLGVSIYEFIKFCDFIEHEKPFATPKGALSTKACYEVNKLLQYPKAGAKKTDRMDQYPSVSLWFLIAKEAGLIAYTETKGSKSTYTTTSKYVDFKRMNLFSQYLLIFYIWFCFVDGGTQYNEGGLGSIVIRSLDRIFTRLAENGSEKWIKNDQSGVNIFDEGSDPAQMMMKLFYKSAHNLRDLGLIEFEEGAKLNKYFKTPIISLLKPTEFGAVIFGACEQRKYTAFNVHYEDRYFELLYDRDAEDDPVLDQQRGEAFEPEMESFVTPFLDCFPQGSIDIATIRRILYEYDNLHDDNRVFEFKVSLSKKCYRVIRCLPMHTFEDLHLAIQDAFDFGDDHLYAFFLDGKFYSKYAVNSPFTEEPPFADELCLGNCRLTNKQRILYLFDFGDEWTFDIVLDVKYDTGVIDEDVKIIKSVGKSPEQYPDRDDDDEEDE
ncbi:MAG: plasmid pRiA4b ORF-3 family protein [Methanomicrobiales archaeon]|jgi:hypothetical protein|nr:plasmid pRiA4b ORF-3 family protein [Methanomicrobiales archaeon]